MLQFLFVAWCFCMAVCIAICVIAKFFFDWLDRRYHRRRRSIPVSNAEGDHTTLEPIVQYSAAPKSPTWLR